MDETDITARDYFAGLAMQQFMAEREDKEHGTLWEDVARDAYTMAHFMMRERARPRTEGGSYADKPIEAMELTVRTERILKHAGIKTVSQLLACSQIELLKIPSLGQGRLQEIQSECARRGYGALHIRQPGR